MQDNYDVDASLNLVNDDDDGLLSRGVIYLDDQSFLPCKLIITNVPDAVFDSDEAKVIFQQLFCAFESSPEFEYLKTFRRARVVFSHSKSATRARVHLHEHELFGSTIKCYFAQPLAKEGSRIGSSQYLNPPMPEKQFLISPPSSPPAGWEPVNEKQPSINFDLITAITNLTPGVGLILIGPGVAHEVHLASETHPSIVVHVCEDPEGFKSRTPIMKTRSPLGTDQFINEADKDA